MNLCYDFQKWTIIYADRPHLRHPSWFEELAYNFEISNFSLVRRQMDRVQTPSIVTPDFIYLTLNRQYGYNILAKLNASIGHIKYRSVQWYCSTQI
jgi:hypothetical protein